MSRNVNSFRADQAKQVEDLLDRLRQHDNIQDQNVAPVTKPVEIKAQDIQEAPAHRQANIEKQYSDNLAHALIKPESFGQSQNGQHKVVVKASEGSDIHQNPYQPNQAQEPNGVHGVSLRQPQEVQNQESLAGWQRSELAYEQAIDANENKFRLAFLNPTTTNDNVSSNQVSQESSVQEGAQYFDATPTQAPLEDLSVDAQDAIGDITSADFRFPSDLTNLKEFFSGAQIFSGQGQNYSDAERTQTLIKSAQD
ncbi:MAG: hypothetical protein QGI45_07110 [Myxococcota bacterium]|jgi:hypothetical protein|nr:hypothetical protein [Myxococcota bacterium]